MRVDRIRPGVKEPRPFRVGDRHCAPLELTKETAFAPSEGLTRQRAPDVDAGAHKYPVCVPAALT